jgi:hypothetical protein
MAKKFNPATMAANWQQGMTAKAGNWAAGTQATTADIGQAAIAKAAQAQANYTKSVAAGGSWYTAMENLTLAYWKQQCQIAAKSGRFASGAQKGLAKMQAFANKVGPYYAQMAMAAAAETTWQAKVVAAIQVLVDAGKKNGSGLLS